MFPSPEASPLPNSSCLSRLPDGTGVLLSQVWELVSGTSNPPRCFFPWPWVVSSQLCIQVNTLCSPPEFSQVLFSPSTDLSYLVSLDSQLCLLHPPNPEALPGSPSCTSSCNFSQAISWGHPRAHFVSFQPLREHSPLLPDIHCLEKHCFIYFVSLFYFRQEVNPILLLCFVQNQNSTCPHYLFNKIF